MNWTTLTIPAWAVSLEAQAWFYGFAIGATVRIFRTVLRWVKRYAADHFGSN